MQGLPASRISASSNNNKNYKLWPVSYLWVFIKDWIAFGQSVERKVGKKNTQSAWKVNSYVLETSGVLIFFSLPSRPPSFALTFYELRAIISGWEKMIYERNGDGKKFPVLFLTFIHITTSPRCPSSFRAIKKFAHPEKGKKQARWLPAKGLEAGTKWTRARTLTHKTANEHKIHR